MRPRDQHQQLLAEAVGFFDVVRDEQRGAAIRGECFLKLRFHLAAQMRVERGERLIEQQRFGLDRKRARQRHALLLAAGKLARIAGFEAVSMGALDERREAA